MAKKIFVTGPTGTQGLPVVRELLAKGFEVRAFALETDPKVGLLKELGAEVVFGDILDEESIYKSLGGIWGVFFLNVIPSSADPSREIGIGKNMISAVERAGVEYMVHSSVDRAGEEETFKRWGPDFWPGYDGYWKGKSGVIKQIKASRIPHWTILKPAYMLDCFVPPKAWGMYPDLKHGVVASARLPETRVPSMCGDDVGKFVADAFANFEKYEHRELPLACCVITMAESAEEIARATGKKIEVKYATRAELLATGGRDSVIDAQEWDNVNGYKADVEFTRSFGIPLSTFREWCVRHRDDFDIE